MIAEEFIEAIKKNDLTTVRAMIADRFVMDPTFKKLDEYIKYAEERIPDLYEEYNSEEFKDSNWDKAYMNEQLNKLMFNFSKERITHLRKVCSSIYGERIKEIEKSRIEEKNKSIKTKQIATGSVIVGAVGLAAGMALSEVVVSVVGGVLVIGGAVVLINGKNRK